MGSNNDDHFSMNEASNNGMVFRSDAPRITTNHGMTVDLHRLIHQDHPNMETNKGMVTQIKTRYNPTRCSPGDPYRTRCAVIHSPSYLLETSALYGIT